MTSDIDICNIALQRLGTRSNIVSFNDQSAEAQAAKICYPLARDSLLCAHRWGFATRHVSLRLIPLDANDPRVSVWPYRHAFPADCLQARSVFGSAQILSGFEIALDADTLGAPLKVILTDVSPATLVYTAALKEPSLFESSFLTALTWKLAADMCASLVGDLQVATTLELAARTFLDAAKANDANQSLDTLAQPSFYGRV